MSRPVAAWTASAQSLNDRLRGDIAPVHDPCIVKANGLYHVFCTGHEGDGPGLIPWRTSRDLVHWELEGPLFPTIPAWAKEAVPGTRGMSAPDIAFFNGRYHLWYSCSTFGSNRSVIGLATNLTLDPASPDYRWEDRGLVIESYREDDFNAIDSNHIEDREGNHWLSLGSFWSGLKLIGPIMTETGGPAWRQTIFHPFAQASRYARGSVLRTKVDSESFSTDTHSDVPFICTSAIHDAESGGVTVLALNRHTTESMELEIEQRGFDDERSVTFASELHHSDLKAVNSKDAADEVSPQKLGGVSFSRGMLRATLKPLSWNVIVTSVD